MAVLLCRKCGHQLVADDPTCPQCGHEHFVPGDLRADTRIRVIVALFSLAVTVGVFLLVLLAL